MGARIGPLHLRRSIPVQASPERVWRELASFARSGYEDGWDGRHSKALRAIVEAAA